MMSIKLYNCSCIRVGYDCHWEVRARIEMASLFRLLAHMVIISDQ